MDRTRVLALVQAGGAGSRMDVLTRERAKPTLPFAGVFQLVDFPLSNLRHSGIADVWLAVQFQGGTLEGQVANGRPWDLDRTRGGLRLLMPQQGTGSEDEEGFASGNADLLYRVRDELREAAPDVLLVMSADHVYRCDYRDLVEAHLAHGAECTVLTTEVDLAEARDHAVVELDGDRVTAVSDKPDDPATGVVATEVFAYDPVVLVEVLEELHRDLDDDSEDADSGLGDFAEHLLPRLVERGRTRAHPLEGYWRDLGQPHRYLAAHRDVLREDVGVLDVPGWPVLTQQPQRGPARVLAGAEVVDSLVSPGAQVAGRVLRSVLGPGVVVEEGAEVADSVVFTGTVVRSGARVAFSIVDTGCRLEEGAVVGSADADPDDNDQIVVVGRDCVVGAGVHVGAGARLEPGTTA